MYKLVKSFGYAVEGITFAIKTQNNFRIQIFLGTVALLLSYLLKISRMEWLIILITICIVLFAELINTVVEEMVNLTTSDFHPHAKLAKDVAAGAVLVVSILALTIGTIIFVPYFY